MSCGDTNFYFRMNTPLLTANYSEDNFSEKFYASESKFMQVIFEFLTLCSEDKKSIQMDL